MRIKQAVTLLKDQECVAFQALLQCACHAMPCFSGTRKICNTINFADDQLKSA